MARQIEIKQPHNFEKVNLMTLSDSKSTYDQMQCTRCGIKGKRRSLGFVEVDGRHSEELIQHCDRSKVELPDKIKITECRATGAQFENLTPGSIHDVVEPPEGHQNDFKGVWVQGVGEPVKGFN